MSNSKKLPLHNIYLHIFYVIIAIFCLFTPELLRITLFFITNHVVSLYLIMYAHFIFPIYFSPHLCYLMYCFGFNWLFLSTQLFLLAILTQSNKVSVTNSTIHYNVVILTFLFILLLGLVLSIFVYYGYEKSLPLKKYFLLICLIVFISINLRFKYFTFLTSPQALTLYPKITICLFGIIFLLSGFFIYISYKKKVSFSSIENSSIVIGTLFPIIHSFVYIYSFFVPESALLQCSLYTGSLLFLLLLYRHIPQSSLISWMDDLNSKLLLHRESNTLLKKYIQNIDKSNEAISEQYEYLNTQYGQILSVYPDALFLLDDNGMILHINEKASYLLDISCPSEVLGKPITDFIRTNDTIYIKSLIKNILDEKSYRLTTLSQVTSCSNESKDVEILLTLSSYTCPKQVIMSIKDISYRNYTYDLEQQVTLEKLKVEFFSTLSHELKTPVNVIYSASQLQSQIIQDQDYDKIPTYNSMISVNCLRLLKLINNILDLNRVDSDYFHVTPRTINIITATEDILDSTLPYAEKRDMSVTFDTDVEELYCSIDPDMLERILLNLFSNAIKYGKPNGNLVVTMSHINNFVRISIADDGIGIPNGSHDSIFDRFSRAENGLIRTNEGAGIGLSLVKSFVELNKGSITFNSIENEGTDFIIYFPTLGTDEPENIATYSNFANSDKVEMEFSDIFS